MHTIDYPGFGMTSICYLHDIFFGYGGRPAVLGSLQHLKTHVNFMWNFKSGSEATSVESGGEPAVAILLLPPVQRDMCYGREECMPTE